MGEEANPYIPSHVTLPELTVKAIGLAILLAIV